MRPGPALPNMVQSKTDEEKCAELLLQGIECLHGDIYTIQVTGNRYPPPPWAAQNRTRSSAMSRGKDGELQGSGFRIPGD